ncbi:MAG: DUF1810 domain-containing protein [Gammaproteobacteria bacterium HGW-Gammaproteobacteria-12]|nr:MAG: DUF1810 domain-containing protein [Gammaproteobacteria bacterium HGW-Gammaproteobacteria-12]
MPRRWGTNGRRNERSVRSGAFRRGAAARLSAGPRRAACRRRLGRSEMAEHYGISGLDEARAYLAHPLLGPRLEACVRALLLHRARPVRQIMGSPDDLKLRSSMTLFQAAAPQQPLFAEVLQAFYDGEQDAATLQRL